MQDSFRVRQRLAVLVDPTWPDGRLPERGRHAAGEGTPPGKSAAPEQSDEQDEAGDPPRGSGPIGLIRRQVRGPWGRLARRWVPEPLRDSRVDPGRRGAVVLTVIAALAAVIAAVGVWRARPEPRPVQAAAISAISAIPALSAGAPTGPASGGALPTGEPLSTSVARAGAAAVSRPGTAGVSRPATPPTALLVSVTGRVARPGLVRLRAGARVADAIAAAGGAGSDADLTGLNLAQPLQDGQSVVVSGGPAPPAGGSKVVGGDESAGALGRPGTAAAGTDVAGPPVDLNSADVQALDALPGVGPVTAAAIVAWREKNGRFTSVDQLQEIAGIGPAKFARLAPRVRV